MNIYMGLGILSGLVIGLLLLVFWLKVAKKDGKIKSKYDERQAIARGKGFKISFCILMIYDGIYGVIGIMVDKPFIDPLAAMTVGMCLAAAIYAAYCIWNDAYFTLNDNPKRLLFGLGFFGVFNLVLGTINIISGDVITNGMLNFRITNFVCGILFIVVYVTFFAKRIRNINDEKKVTI